jgi:hypothetical protein
MFKKLFAATLAACSLSPSAAFADPTASLAWVSALGADTPTCGALATPCRTFQYAHDNIVAAGGKIHVRDPGGYSPVVIGKAISIINAGVGVAAISKSSGVAVSVQAGSTDTVLLQGLTLDGGGTGNIGIDVASAGFFGAANCTIKGFSQGSGLRIAPGNNMKFSVSDSSISGGANGSVRIQASPNTVTGTLTRLEVVGSKNGSGVYVGSSAVVMASQLNASNNAANGVDVFGTLVLGRSMITGNDNGVNIGSGGTVYSYRNNQIDNNNVNVQGGALSTTFALR